MKPFELIFIDNGSTDGTVEYLMSLGRETVLPADKSNPIRRVTVVVNVKNCGFPAAANQGTQTSTHQQIVLLNNDTLTVQKWQTIES